MSFDQQLADITRAIAAAEALVESVTFDMSGKDGRGGNGGLISNDTIRRADETRQAIFRARKVLP